MYKIFKDRKEAGQALANKLKRYRKKIDFVFAIPNGGVAIGYEIAKAFSTRLDVVIVRKIQLPWDTEAGFGACAPDECVLLNKKMIQSLGLTKSEIIVQKQRTFLQIKQRNKKYREGRPYPDLKNKSILICDDGLATGYTMLAAIRFLRKKHPKEIIVAVPCASAGAYAFIKEKADKVVSLNIKSEFPFAVADFYERWYDVSDQEVLEYLKNEKR